MADNVKSSAIIEEITTLARKAKSPVQKTSRKELDKIAKGHQGVVLEVGRFPTVELDDILRRALKQAEPAFIVVLDHIEDPHNLGAILRTAEVVGVHGVVIPKQRAVGITPAVVNASAGAAESPTSVRTGRSFILLPGASRRSAGPCPACRAASP